MFIVKARFSPNLSDYKLFYNIFINCYCDQLFIDFCLDLLIISFFFLRNNNVIFYLLIITHHISNLYIIYLFTNNYSLHQRFITIFVKKSISLTYSLFLYYLLIIYHIGCLFFLFFGSTFSYFKVLPCNIFFIYFLLKKILTS